MIFDLAARPRSTVRPASNIDAVARHLGQGRGAPSDQEMALASAGRASSTVKRTTSERSLVADVLSIHAVHFAVHPGAVSARFRAFLCNELDVRETPSSLKSLRFVTARNGLKRAGFYVAKVDVEGSNPFSRSISYESKRFSLGS